MSMLSDEGLKKTFASGISYGLEFAFYKKVMLKGKTLKLWSQAH